jgi:hypothetical protein
MSIAGFVNYKLTGSTNITSIVSTSGVFPDKSTSSPPYIVYSFQNQTKNKTFRLQIVSIKSIETTQDLCNTLNEKVFQLFDDSTTQQRELYNDLKIESIAIINNIPSIYDDQNNNWFGVTDIRINYIK